MTRPMNSVSALWKSAVKDSLDGVSDWLKRLLKATHYHPEKAYMRVRRDDRRMDRRGPTDGETSIRGF